MMDLYLPVPDKSTPIVYIELSFSQAASAILLIQE